jgi:hypothetical protein
MALGWLAVLQIVPWNEVMKNAPMVADGARKLWNAIARKKFPSPEALAIATLPAQVAALEIAVADLHSHMLASSELIKALAEQNTQIIQRIEANRIRVLWLTGATVVVGILAVSSLALVLVR